MSKSLVDALKGEAWSVSAVVFDLNDMLDNEGRPISERRADAVVRSGVEMEMRECPYSGIRQGHLMNVSALAQISHYFNHAAGEMAAFRRAAGADATWFDMLASIVDLLSQPAIYLLQQHNASGPVPADAAVCHKLAAGFFGVLRGIHERLALGATVPLTVDGLLAVVDEMGALLGASEACAGSPLMIRRACRALMEGTPEGTTVIENARLERAHCLALQVQLGIFWHLYDQAHLWALLRGEFSGHLTPGNNFLKNKLSDAYNKLSLQAPHLPLGAMLPEALDAELREKLAAALGDQADPQALEQDIQDATLLLNTPGSIVRYDGEIARFAQRVACYLQVHRLVREALCRLEQELRVNLDYPADTPVRLGPAVFPIPQALFWYEHTLGRHIGQDGRLTGSASGTRSPASIATL